MNRQTAWSSTAEALGHLPGVSIGHLAGVDAEGQPLVRWEDGQEARPAQVAWTSEPPQWARCEGLRVILAFENGNPDQPIVLGLLDAPPKSVTQRKPKTLRVESEKELVIECGKAKIALRSDGRIEIRGGHLVSRSSGPNKIKGSSVHIN